MTPAAPRTGEAERAPAETGDRPPPGGATPEPSHCLVSGMASFGGATRVSQVVRRSFPVWLGSGLRMAIAAALLVPGALVAVRREGSGPLAIVRDADGRDRWLLAGIAVIGTFGFSALVLLGMREAPGAVGAVVMATTPAVTAMGAVAFLGVGP